MRAPNDIAIDFLTIKRSDDTLLSPKDCHDQKLLFRALFAEFGAMSIFVFFGTGCVSSTGSVLTTDGVSNSNTVSRLMPIGMAFGMSIMILVYGIGNISGGHINPAVTIFLWLIKKISTLKAILYIIVQTLGALFGSLMLWGATANIYGESVGTPPFSLGANGINQGITAANGLALETFGTFYLCFIVLLTAVKRGAEDAHLAPLCIGMTIFIVHVVLIPFTGCGINPARTFGVAVINSMAGNNVWDANYFIYFLGPVLGAMLASFCSWMLFDYEPEVEIHDEKPQPTYNIPGAVLPPPTSLPPQNTYSETKFGDDVETNADRSDNIDSEEKSNSVYSSVSKAIRGSMKTKEGQQDDHDLRVSSIDNDDEEYSVELNPMQAHRL